MTRPSYAAARRSGLILTIGCLAWPVGAAIGVGLVVMIRQLV